MVVGIAFLTSVLVVTLVDDFLLPNFVVPGDTSALARDIEANPETFLFAAIGYLTVLVLDSIIAVALYVVLKPASRTRAALMSALRLLYAAVLTIGVLALLFQVVDAYGYAQIKLLGYIFFASHILVLGYSVILSGYIPKALGVWLIVAAFTYAVFFVDIQLPAALSLLTMLTMAGAELALSVWLLVKRKNLPERSFRDTD